MYFLRNHQIPLSSETLRLSVRILEAALAFVIFCVVGSVSFSQIEGTNNLYSTHAYRFLIANGVLLWLYTSALCLLKLDKVKALIPPAAFQIMHGKGSLTELALDTVFLLFSFSGSVSASVAVSTSVCGGKFPVDVCYTLDDICKMSNRNNPAFVGFDCPLSLLQAGVAMTFILIPILVLSWLLVWREFRATPETHRPLTHDQENDHSFDPKDTVTLDHAEMEMEMRNPEASGSSHIMQPVVDGV